MALQTPHDASGTTVWGTGIHALAVTMHHGITSVYTMHDPLTIGRGLDGGSILPIAGINCHVRNAHSNGHAYPTKIVPSEVAPLGSGLRYIAFRAPVLQSHLCLWSRDRNVKNCATVAVAARFESSRREVVAGEGGH